MGQRESTKQESDASGDVLLPTEDSPDGSISDSTDDVKGRSIRLVKLVNPNPVPSYYKNNDPNDHLYTDFNKDGSSYPTHHNPQHLRQNCNVVTDEESNLLLKYNKMRDEDDDSSSPSSIYSTPPVAVLNKIGVENRPIAGLDCTTEDVEKMMRPKSELYKNLMVVVENGGRKVIWKNRHALHSD